MPRHPKKWKKVLTGAAILTAAACIIGSGASNFGALTDRAAMLSVGLAFPEGGLSLLNGDHGALVQEGTHAAAAPPNETSQPPTVSAASSQAASSEASSTPETSETVSQAPEPTEVPEDQRGPIQEQKIGTSGDNFENVWVKNSTGRTISIQEELEKTPDINMQDDGPKVLIMHTHTTEGYELFDRGYYDKSYSIRTTDATQSVVRVGDEIQKALEAQGIGVIHDTTVHDYPAYNGSYGRSADTVKAQLEKNPSIQVVLDIHRDGITREDGTRVKPTVEIDGKKAAQVMIIAGCESESVSHPDWELNLRLAMRLQQNLATNFPDLARPLKFMNANYNQNLTHGSILIEMGSEANTLDEAMYSGQMVGQALGEVLNQLKE
ncbi:stage II sporulation protein P [Solibaculum mannosilyticum]|uniref:stage II sporulation protein P n=1 Tax=Solibaculum mannosilyticum TaxID=2780922 RepID=UPI0034BD35D5